MNRSLQIRGGLAIAVLLVSLYLLIPTFRLTGITEADREVALTDPDQKARIDQIEAKAIRRGLDLEGGMYVVLEVDQEGMSSDQARDALNRVREIIANRVDQFGVSEPVIQVEGNSRIIVQLPGLQDPERARELIGKTAQLEFRLVRPLEDYQQVLQKLDNAFAAQGTKQDEDFDPEAGPESLEQVEEADLTEAPEPVEAATEVAAGLDSIADIPSGVDSAAVAAADSFGDPFGDLAPPAPGLEDIDTEDPYFKEHPFSAYCQFEPQMADYFGTPLFVEERNFTRVSHLLRQDEAGRYEEVAAHAIPRDMVFMFHSEAVTLEGIQLRPLFLLEDIVSLTGERLTDARSTPDPERPGGWQVEMGLDRRGARVFSKITGENIGRNLAIVLDGRVASAPNIRTKIPNGKASITGSFTSIEASDLSLLLRAGALPTEVRIEEERTVGPSLGQDSIRKGVTAALYGSILVVMFILLYYRLSGLITVLALVSNIVILLAVLAQFGLVLTLPGIAGIILTVGMAVDANVLINERIREELRKDKTVRAAVESGYANATRTIVDANVTTLIAAAILLWFGTGPIKGFAVTLSIGILSSMFTALVLTKVIMELWARNKGHLMAAPSYFFGARFKKAA